MTIDRLLLSLLVAAFLSVDAAIAVSGESAPNYVVHGSFFAAQVSLIAIWSGLGRAPAVVRMLAAIATVAAGTALFAHCIPLSHYVRAATLGLQFGFSYAAALSLRLIGICVTRIDVPRRDHVRSLSLASLFSLITVLSVVAAILRTAPDMTGELIFWVRLLSSLAISSVAICVLLLATRNRRTSSMAIATLYAGAAVSLFPWRDGIIIPRELLELNGTHLAASAVAAWVVRCCGWRMYWGAANSGAAQRNSPSPVSMRPILALHLE